MRARIEWLLAILLGFCSAALLLCAVTWAIVLTVAGQGVSLVRFPRWVGIISQDGGQTTFALIVAVGLLLAFLGVRWSRGLGLAGLAFVAVTLAKAASDSHTLDHRAGLVSLWGIALVLVIEPPLVIALGVTGLVVALRRTSPASRSRADGEPVRGEVTEDAGRA